MVKQYELFDGSYSLSDIQKDFEHIIEKSRTLVHKPSVQIYVKRTENRIIFKIKKEYFLELSMDAFDFVSMISLEQTERRITKGKYSEDVPQLEITEVDLKNCNLVHNTYQQYSGGLYKFTPDISFGQLIDILPSKFVFLITFISEFFARSFMVY